LILCGLCLAATAAGCGISNSPIAKVDKVDRQSAAPARELASDAPAGTLEAFMTEVIENVDSYWEETLATAGQEAPSVRYAWLPPGSATSTGCGATAGDGAAFYCPNDDTIYISEAFASRFYQAGDFAVAYVIAHEYAHNVQSELGVYANAQGQQAKPFELQADCLAGTWANAADKQGILEAGDIEEGLETALAIGDFEYESQQHHGTPEERRDALLNGYENGSPSACNAYTQQT
jgi:predicted metalloprotease